MAAQLTLTQLILVRIQVGQLLSLDETLMGHSSVWLEHISDTDEVLGSNPNVPTHVYNFQSYLLLGA